MNKLIHGTWQEELPKIESESVDLIIIDPPYIVTKEKWDKEEVVNSKLSFELFRIAKQNCSIYIWCGIGEKSQSLIRWFPIFNKDWYFKDLITWKKQRGIGMRKGWLYTREEILWFVKDNKKFIWNKKNQYSEEKSQYTGKGVSENGKLTNQFGKERLSEYKRISNVWIDIHEKSTSIKTIHFTPKPKKAIERIILAHTKKNDTVLDCFLGSGTTMEVCNNLNRFCIGIEKELEYYEYCKQFIE